VWGFCRYCGKLPLLKNKPTQANVWRFTGMVYDTQKAVAFPADFSGTLAA